MELFNSIMFVAFIAFATWHAWRDDYLKSIFFIGLAIIQQVNMVSYHVSQLLEKIH